MSTFGFLPTRDGSPTAIARLRAMHVSALASSPFKMLLVVTSMIAATSALTGDPVVVWMIGFAVSLIGFAATVLRTQPNTIAKEAPQLNISSGPRWSLRGMFAVIACLALILSTLIHQSPFRLRFALARNAIDSLAERADRGEVVETPCWAGTFIIRQVEVHPTSRPGITGNAPKNTDARIFLWTKLNPDGRTGFARAVEPKNARFFIQRRLDERWWFVVED